MPDYSFIANPQTSSGLQTLSSIMNTAATAQNIQRGGVALEQERALLQPNIERGQAEAKRAGVEAEKAKLDFTQQERGIVGTLYGVLGRAGVNDPKIVDSELQNLRKSFAGNKTMEQYIDNARIPLQMLPPGPHITKTLITSSQALLSPSEQQSQLSQQPGTVNLGGTTTPTVITPSVGGNAPSVQIGNLAPNQPALNTLAPNTQEFNPLTNTPQYVGPKATGGTSVQAGPTLGVNEAAGGAGTTVATDWKQTFDAGTKAAQNIGVLQEIKKYAPGAVAGVAQDRRAFLTGLAGLIGMDAGQMEKTDTDLLAKNTNMLALAGGNTNLAKELSEVANPNVHMTKEAITRAANQVIAQQQLLLIRQQHLAKFANDPQGYTKAATEFNQNADPRVLQYPSLSVADRVEMKKAMNPQERAAFGAKLQFFQKNGYLQ